MTIGILGTPSKISTGGSYTPAAGSNRVVLLMAAIKNSAGGNVLSKLNWNSIDRTPTVAANDSSTVDRDGVGICVFKESELPGGSATVTSTWSLAPFDSDDIFCFTIGDVDQTTTVRTSGGVGGTTSSNLTGSIAQTVTVGDFQIGVVGFRNSVSSLLSPQNSWTESFDVTPPGGTGAHGAGYNVAVGTSSPCQWLETSGGSDDGYALATVALIPFSGSSPVLMGQACL